MDQSSPTNRPQSHTGTTETFMHPGQHVRDAILKPKGLTVTAAAKLVGVGRSALSRILNGRVPITPDMAARLERTFGVPARELLELQAKFDAAHTIAKDSPTKAFSYVPPFLSIKATDIEEWVSRNISARTRLSVLLRTLINSTSTKLTQVDFPGNDDAERHGWDGTVDAAEGNPWIPSGRSGWEFGTNQDIKTKATQDLAKAVKATNEKEREETTFVFVTPRHWPGKKDWITEQKAKKQWKDVRAYDSSELEQWLEQSLAGQTWFSNETQRPSHGVRTLDQWWTDWADVADPTLSGAFFRPAVDHAKRMFVSWLSKEAEKPIVIAADSTEEGLAFLSQLFREKELVPFRDRVLVFDERGQLPKLARGKKDFVAVTTNREVERELGPFCKTLRSILIYPRNAANADPHIILEPLNYKTFQSGLKEMGCLRDDIAKYRDESGYSLTVLRRRLSHIPEIRTPQWAADHATAASLIPFLFTGAWHSSNEADQTALSLFANDTSHEILEKDCQRLAMLNDAPLWSVGTYRGVVSKIDLLFAIAKAITVDDLKRYFSLAELILGEDDPKLDLPDDERWTAALYGKSREFSSELRKGISETLVLLAVHGNHLFKTRLGFDSEAEASHLVRRLLTPLKTRLLEANDRDLSAYAEAAPKEFLSILEEDLNTSRPESYDLMRPVGNSIGAGCPRAGLLWALEGLAWHPNTLPRVALILAQFAGIKIDDNWGNKPIRSLMSIFRAWMPQTAANHNTRLEVMRLLAREHPEVAWKICIEQLETRPTTGDYSHKPRWRNDGYGFGEPFKTWEPLRAFRNEMIKMALDPERDHDRKMLGDLIEHMRGLSEDDQATVWHLIETWADAGAVDADRAFVREKIRVNIMFRQGASGTATENWATLSPEGKRVYALLEPADLLSKHAWLFNEDWVADSADESHEDLDSHDRAERIDNKRTDALREIYAARELQGIFDLAEMGTAASTIGWLMAKHLLKEAELCSFLLAALPPVSSDASLGKKNILYGSLQALQDEPKRTAVLRSVQKTLPAVDFCRLLIVAPYCRATWVMVDELDQEHRDAYWREIEPCWIRDSARENGESVRRLLGAKRPRVAFQCVRFHPEVLNPDVLFRLMKESAEGGNDQPGQYQPSQYHIEKAFQILNESSNSNTDQMAGLEFAYIAMLSTSRSRRRGYGIPNLEQYIESHPELFVQTIVWTYKRRNRGEDPEEWAVDSKNAEHLAERGYHLLDALTRIPGHDKLGELQADRLGRWVQTVRDACGKLDRRVVADQCIGQLLARAPQGADGVWPCEPVREVMEDIRSKEMANGARMGVFNGRGAFLHGEGGDQERELAARYREWATKLKYSHPFVSEELLMGMVSSYEHDAEREDIEVGIQRRLR